MSEEPWYQEGLRFACTRCGDCCGGGPGTVRANGAEIAALARRLSMSEVEFLDWIRPEGLEDLEMR